MKGVVNFGLFILFVFSLLVTFAYSVALYEKIRRPSFKNLPTDEFVIIGIFVVALLTADYFIIKRLMRKK